VTIFVVEDVVWYEQPIECDDVGGVMGCHDARKVNFTRIAARGFMPLKPLSECPDNLIGSDLCYASIDEQFNTCDITAVIGCKEGDGFCDIIRSSHPFQGYSAQKVLV
jgi:hypothetical protein